MMDSEDLPPPAEVAGLELAERIYAKGVDVFDGCEVTVTDLGQRDPKVVALTLLARTLSEMRAATLLLEHDMVVEARTMVRGMCENLFWAAALAKKGSAFVDEMELDDITNRKARAGGLLDWAKAQANAPDFVETLEGFKTALVDDHGKTWGIKLEQAAAAGGVKDLYIVYRELSTDAAHPSAASLSRHVTLEDDETKPPFTVHAAPTIGPEEAVETVELMCSASLGVVVAVNEILGDVPVGESLATLGQDFVALSGSNKARRESGDGTSGPIA